MNVVETMLSAGADSAPAIFCRANVVTYGELRQKVARVATTLLEDGYRKGDRIGIVSENSAFFVAAYLGIMQAGLVAVPFPTDVAEARFLGMVSTTGMQGVFASSRCTKRVGPWVEELGLSLLSERYGNSASLDRVPRFPQIDKRSDLAALMFTSGSTGAPKAVKVTHRNIECNTLDIVAYIRLRPDDRVMVVLPFHYCFGLSLLHSHLTAGASLVLNNEFKLFPEGMLAEMQRRQCTGLAGVPSTYQILLRRSRFRELPFPCLRWFQQAGGKLPNACIREILTAFPHVQYFLMYGQTEGTARLSYLPPERLADKLGSIGRGLPSTKLEVLSLDGSSVAPGSDETGEIVATGDNITPGYWNDPLETSKFFKADRLYTGDIARVDSEGFVFIVERERDMIKSGGNRVSAKEVEDVIAELQSVVEVAVVGAPHDLLGEAIKAFILPTEDGGVTAEEVQTYCRTRLPAFKVPEEVIFLRAMAHNGSGKVLKQELKKMLADRQLTETQAAIR